MRVAVMTHQRSLACRLPCRHAQPVRCDAVHDRGVVPIAQRPANGCQRMTRALGLRHDRLPNVRDFVVSGFSNQCFHRNAAFKCGAAYEGFQRRLLVSGPDRGGCGNRAKVQCQRREVRDDPGQSVGLVLGHFPTSI